VPEKASFVPRREFIKPEKASLAPRREFIVPERQVWFPEGYLSFPKVVAKME